MSVRRKVMERKIGHRRVDEEGQITFKKIQTSQIMGSIQLGIGHAIGSLASKPERDLLMHDFTIVETTPFPKDGSNTTPAHHYNEFKFKSYAPVAFRYFRDLFGIQPDDFLFSLCNYPMRELTNPGASGSIFYLTYDDEFIIKTVQHKEAEFLQKLLPGYYMNLNQNQRTLLPKFYGLYCYQCGGKNVRLAVMNNLLPSMVRLHEKYDLKGSTYKRKANKYERAKASPTFKDLDFMDLHKDGILLEPEKFNGLTKTMQRDCRVLESFKIMDYSLLLGIYNVDLANREKIELRKKEEEGIDRKASSDSDSAATIQATDSINRSHTGLVRSKSINRQRLAAFSTAMESIQVEVEVVDEDDDVPRGGIPAKNSKGEHLLLFLGIIDILQSYRLTKKIEHTWKAVFHDGDTVSVHRPGFYAQRFQDFMGKTVFRKLPVSLKRSPSRKRGALSKQKATVESDLPRSLAKISSQSEDSQDDDTTIAAPLSSPAVLSRTDTATIDTDLKNNTLPSASKESQKPLSNIDPMPPRIISLRSASSVSKAMTVSWDKSEVVSLSQITIQTDATTDCVSETSSPSTSGVGSSVRTVKWTPPHSIEGSTPTHTEGTPSFTESSSSGDAGCPTTPVKTISKCQDTILPANEVQNFHDAKSSTKSASSD